MELQSGDPARREWVAQAPVPVLIVDDDAAYVNFLRAAFAHMEGIRLELVHVTRLRDVMPTLRKRPVPVVLLDINLPDGNGLAWLRLNRPKVDASVIVLTSIAGYAAGPDVVEGAQDFLVKSEIDPEQLARVVQYAADRERARRELVRSRVYFQSLIEQARDLITVVDERGTILYQSPGTSTLLGIPPEEFVGKSLYDVVDQEQGARGRELLESVFSGRDDVPSGQFTVRRRDGGLRFLDVVASRIAPEDGVRRVVLNSRDVTERQRAEEALRARDEMLRQSQRMEAVGRLAGGIAHDFSNVLTVVTAACERLRDQLAAGEPPPEIGMILRNCARAGSLVRQLLAFSRQQTLAPRPIDLGALVRTSSDLLKQFIGEHIQLDIDIAPDLHPVEADPGQIEQVLMNLTINARDAMAGGGRLQVRLRNVRIDPGFAEAHPPQMAGDYVMLQVQDTGHGMDADARSRAFEPFFTTKDPSQGSGLGLSTVYGIVKQSGGYVWIDSEPKHGATVSVYLPPTTALPVPDAAPRPRLQGAVPQRTLMLTEDETDVRELIHDMLTMQGFEVIAACDPADALERAANYEGTIHLLLTDVVMPGGTGRDLARLLTATRPAMKVLYMSGYPEHGAAPGSVLEPGAPFLSKPFTREQLLQKIRDVLE